MDGRTKNDQKWAKKRHPLVLEFPLYIDALYLQFYLFTYFHYDVVLFMRINCHIRTVVGSTVTMDAV